MRPFELPVAGGYVVALSGGADSRLLLELTVRAALVRGMGERVTAAHLHHGIRGEEADRDEAFCRDECQKLGIPLYVEHADIPALCRRTGQSEETAAREARYEFLIRVMKETDSSILLTAHNADDQLETILHRLLRGSGTRGMVGIPAVRSLCDTLAGGAPLLVYRPLLSWSRRDILEAMQTLGLSYVTDSTNLADGCTRNRLRHRVIPLLEELAGAGVPQAAAVRFGQAAAEDEEVLSAIARAQYDDARPPSDPSDGLPVTAIAPMWPAVAKRMIRLSYIDFNGGQDLPDRTLSAAHLEDLFDLCRHGREGAVSDPLPGHVRAEIRNGFLVFSDIRPAAMSCPAEPRLLQAGVNVWQADSPRITITVDMCDRSSAAPEAPSPGAAFASASFPPTVLPLMARGREPGDVIRSHGMTKKLKKLLCDQHIPIELRDRLPLICLEDGTPLWFPRVAFRDGFLPPEDGPSVRVTVHVSD